MTTIATGSTRSNTISGSCCAAIRGICLVDRTAVLNVAQIVVVIEAVGLGIDRTRIIASTIQRII
ncbi:hypothetical protein, partial [Sulfitobacter sp.]|uniref:hypothetical protein n=1 Tax=Sulfitobacter sp. TaxID=1903071 RepID=UPI00272B84EB